MVQPSDSSSSSSDRDKKGRFAKGHKLSIGPRRRAVPPEYQKALRKAVTPAEWAKAVKAILQMAIAGDVKAFRALAPYLMGLPVQQIQAEIDIGNVITLEKWLVIAAERRAAVTGEIIEGEIVEGPPAPELSEKIVALEQDLKKVP